MLFINPKWDNEAERIGKQRCTRLGYALHGVSDLLGFVALLVLVGVGAYLGYREIIGTFETRLLWLLPPPFASAVVGAVLYRLSWVIARRRGFRYDYDSREVSWLENGQRRTYKYHETV